MNTGTRRFILRLAVGLLTFLLGVAAVWALSGLNPFQNSSGTRYYRYKRCGQFRSWSAPLSSDRLEASSIDEPVFLKGPHGCRMKIEFGSLSPTEAPAPAIAR
jgi:hypothetical protein